MIIKLSLDSEKPLYQQLKESIMLALARGELAEGEVLPSVRQLASSLAINMHTVNKAYNQLADEGFLTMRKGKGAIVNPKKDYLAGDKEKDFIMERLSVICSEAKCRSLSKENLINMCEEAFDNIEKKDEYDL
jgi:DNA-binding transcriptional regulator YhcF (GntR family)